MSLHSALRAQLGVAVPAMSIAKETNVDPEPCLLFFGIVDFLQVCISCNLLLGSLALTVAAASLLLRMHHGAAGVDPQTLKFACERISLLFLDSNRLLRMHTCMQACHMGRVVARAASLQHHSETGFGGAV